MSNGVKIGLLAVIAALLAIITWKLVSKAGDEQLSKEIQTGTAATEGQYDASTQARIDQAANATGKPQPNTMYAPDKNGNPDYSKPLNSGTPSTMTQEQPGPQSVNRPKTAMKFETVEHDFGTIKEGDVVTYSFKFTNGGSNPLIIEDAKGSCGCTVPKWPKEPIAPGKSDLVEVTFNSTGKTNAQTKMVTLTANTEPLQTKLTIKANVLPKDPNKAPSASH